MDDREEMIFEENKKPTFWERMRFFFSRMLNGVANFFRNLFRREEKTELNMDMLKNYEKALQEKDELQREMEELEKRFEKEKEFQTKQNQEEIQEAEEVVGIPKLEMQEKNIEIEDYSNMTEEKLSAILLSKIRELGIDVVEMKDGMVITYEMEYDETELEKNIKFQYVIHKDGYGIASGILKENGEYYGLTGKDGKYATLYVNGDEDYYGEKDFEISSELKDKIKETEIEINNLYINNKELVYEIWERNKDKETTKEEQKDYFEEEIPSLEEDNIPDFFGDDYMEEEYGKIEDSIVEVNKEELLEDAVIEHLIDETDKKVQKWVDEREKIVIPSQSIAEEILDETEKPLSKREMFLNKIREFDSRATQISVTADTIDVTFELEDETKVLATMHKDGYLMSLIDVDTMTAISSGEIGFVETAEKLNLFLIENAEMMEEICDKERDKVKPITYDVSKKVNDIEELKDCILSFMETENRNRVIYDEVEKTVCIRLQTQDLDKYQELNVIEMERNLYINVENMTCELEIETMKLDSTSACETMKEEIDIEELEMYQRAIYELIDTNKDILVDEKENVGEQTFDEFDEFDDEYEEMQDRKAKERNRDKQREEKYSARDYNKDDDLDL